MKKVDCWKMEGGIESFERWAKGVQQQLTSLFSSRSFSKRHRWARLVKGVGDGEAGRLRLNRRRARIVLWPARE